MYVCIARHNLYYAHDHFTKSDAFARCSCIDIILRSTCADHYFISSFAPGRVQSPHFLVLSIIYLLPLYVCSSFATPVSVRLAFCFYVSSLMLSCLTWCSWTLFFDFLSWHELYASPCTLLCHSSFAPLLPVLP